MQRVTVYCGSNEGFEPSFRKQSHALGLSLAERGLELVYGGGNIGLMGAIASGCLSGGGRVTGVITEKLMNLEVGHAAVSEMMVVRTMHERKAIMMERGDAFVILPGGYGTLEEFFEVLTWQQLEYHHKPICLYNMNGYFDELIGFVDHVHKKGFLSEEHHQLFKYASTLPELFEKLHEPVESSLAQWKATLSAPEL